MSQPNTRQSGVCPGRSVRPRTILTCELRPSRRRCDARHAPKPLVPPSRRATVVTRPHTPECAGATPAAATPLLMTIRVCAEPGCPELTDRARLPHPPPFLELLRTC